MTATAQETSFVERICLSLLTDTQNPDGGWGFHSGASSRVEPTCWALQSLLCWGKSEHREAVARGVQFLRDSQLANGSWPAMPGENTGSWATSLATWVLLADRKYVAEAAAGVKWVCKDWPRDSVWWRRIVKKISSAHDVAPIDNTCRGWGWTPGTSSWIEPTSYALLMLRRAPAILTPPVATQRKALGEALLYDRVCPGGGWNCGNPMVYGVAGEPLIVPTAWALLALRTLPDDPRKALSLAWMQQQTAQIDSVAAFALLRLVYRAYNLRWPGDNHSENSNSAVALENLYARNQALQNTQVLAWLCLAEGPCLDWLS